LSNKKNIAIVILSGGLGSRLDGKGKYSKSLLGKKLIEHTYDRVKNQTKIVAINLKKRVNNPLQSSNIECIYDFYKENIGPLAGIHAALKFSKKKFPKNDNLICTVPVDAPFLPYDLLDKLYLSYLKSDASITIACSNRRRHPTIALWNTNILTSLENSIEKGIRKIDIFTKEFKIGFANWEYIEIDPFFNINNLRDLKKAENILQNRA